MSTSPHGPTPDQPQAPQPAAPRQTTQRDGTNLLAAAGDPSRLNGGHHTRTPAPEWVRISELPHRVGSWLLTRGVDLTAQTARRRLRVGRAPITRTAIGRPTRPENLPTVTL